VALIILAAIEPAAIPAFVNPILLTIPAAAALARPDAPITDPKQFGMLSKNPDLFFSSEPL
jgi:hypothetical protein